MTPERKFKVEVTATRTLEITMGGKDGIEAMEGENIEDAVEDVARENLFHTENPGAVRDIEGWDITVETVTELQPA